MSRRRRIPTAEELYGPGTSRPPFRYRFRRIVLDALYYSILWAIVAGMCTWAAERVADANTPDYISPHAIEFTE